MYGEENRKTEVNSVDMRETFELMPPEGGWGYIITASLALTFSVTVVPMSAFGLIYGNFLQTIGNETTGTALANGIFNTIFNFSGLVANNLLQKHPYRVVAFIGCFLFCIGSISTIFVTNLVQLIISFGIIQGIGMGILCPAVFTSFNSYFDTKLNLMNGIAQAIMVTVGMFVPVIGKYLMDNFGFRGTLAVLAALSLNGFVAVATLQPVEWHMRKILITDQQRFSVLLSEISPIKTINEEPMQTRPLLKMRQEEEVPRKVVAPRPRSSIISVGDRAMSVTTINRLGKIHARKKTIWRLIVESLDLHMFKDPIFMNISIGLALSFTSDVAFISIIPLILINAGFDESQATLLMTVLFASDLIARILYSIASTLCKIPNRYILLGGAFFSMIFRTAFITSSSFEWKLVSIIALGFLRCFIQTPLPLVIAEKYSDNFATAFSLYMVVCGFISLLFGPLMSFVKSVTQSDVMVVHLLTMAFLICCISWTTELVYVKLCSKERKK